MLHIYTTHKGVINMTKRKHMRLPNGFGSITYKTGNRRNPYSVRKSINGKQKEIGSFATYEEALGYLVEYNKNPLLFSPALITFSELYELMAAEKYPKISKNTKNNYIAVYKHCEPLYSKKFTEITISNLQDIIRTMSDKGIGYASQKKCRQLWHHMFTYAIKYNIVPSTANIAQFVDIDKKVLVYEKKPFNTRQINRVKRLANSDEPMAEWAMCVVMMCYSGVRTGEFISIAKTDVKLKQRYFIVRESKTEAGRNRAVPISKKTLPYFKYWLEQQGKNLISYKGEKLTYHQYRRFFDKVMELTNCKHTPHECRHTCATWLDNAGANETATKRILGHASQGVTKDVYTHKNLHELKRAIDLI